MLGPAIRGNPDFASMAGDSVCGLWRRADGASRRILGVSEPRWQLRLYVPPERKEQLASTRRSATGEPPFSLRGSAALQGPPARGLRGARGEAHLASIEQDGGRALSAAGVSHGASGQDDPRLLALSAALADYAAIHRASRIALPAVSASGFELAIDDWIGETQAVVIHKVNIYYPVKDAGGIIEKYSSSFMLGATEAVESAEDRLQEYLVNGAFSAISLVPVDAGQSRITVDGIDVALRGQGQVTVVARRRAALSES